MQKILVPTDFSPNALKALTYAAEIADQSGALIYLLHVIEPKINMATMQTDSLNKINLENKSKELQSVVQSALAIYPNVKIVPYILGDSVVTSMLEYAEKERFDLIVMGTKGADSGIRKMLIGTVTADAIGKSSIPILSVPLLYELKKPETLLLATDQFEKDEQLFLELTNLAKIFSSSIKIVLVKDKEEERDGEMLEKELKGFQFFLQSKFPEITFESEQIEGNDFEETIESYCELHDVDMIAMVSYPKSFWEKLFRKGNTKTMAFHSSIPILAIPLNK